MIDRRHLLGVIGATAAMPALAGPDPFAEIEATLGRDGVLGFAAVDLRNNYRIGHRAGRRFAFCSTIKLPLVAAVLARIDAGAVQGDRRLAVDAAAILPNSPIVQAALPAGSATVLDLCAGAVMRSDNSAANLLFPLVGGPAGLTRFLRAHGGGAARSDRLETALNYVGENDTRDTVTPDEALRLMEALLVRPALSAASRARLIGWMVDSPTGTKRLRAGLPPGWRAGDKTGTGPGGAQAGDWPGGDVNDLAIAWPTPGAAPILMACLIRARQAPLPVAEAAQAAAARIAVRLLTEGFDRRRRRP